MKEFDVSVLTDFKFNLYFWLVLGLHNFIRGIKLVMRLSTLADMEKLSLSVSFFCFGIFNSSFKLHFF